MSEQTNARYFYRGAWHSVPMGRVTLISSGEAHTTGHGYFRPVPVTWRMMYLPGALVRGVAAELGNRGASPPFFPSPGIVERGIARDFGALHVLAEHGATELELKSRLLALLGRLIPRYAQQQARTLPALTGAEYGLRLARDYLHAYFVDAVSLATLSQVAGMSAFHFCRSFTKFVGVPPHVYQTQLRIARAKALLCQGWGLAKVSREVGFSDQSHFSRRFKRLVGGTPGEYAVRQRTEHGRRHS